MNAYKIYTSIQKLVNDIIQGKKKKSIHLERKHIKFLNRFKKRYSFDNSQFCYSAAKAQFSKKRGLDINKKEISDHFDFQNIKNMKDMMEKIKTMDSNQLLFLCNQPIVYDIEKSILAPNDIQLSELIIEQKHLKDDDIQNIMDFAEIVNPALNYVSYSENFKMKALSLNPEEIITFLENNKITQNEIKQLLLLWYIEILKMNKVFENMNDSQIIELIKLKPNEFFMYKNISKLSKIDTNNISVINLNSDLANDARKLANEIDLTLDTQRENTILSEIKQITKLSDLAPSLMRFFKSLVFVANKINQGNLLNGKAENGANILTQLNKYIKIVPDYHATKEQLKSISSRIDSMEIPTTTREDPTREESSIISSLIKNIDLYLDILSEEQAAKNENKDMSMIKYKNRLEKWTDPTRDIEEMLREIDLNHKNDFKIKMDNFHLKAKSGYAFVNSLINELWNKIESTSIEIYDIAFQRYFFKKKYYSCPFIEANAFNRINCSMIKLIKININNEIENRIVLANVCEINNRFVISATQIAQTHQDYKELKEILEHCVDNCYIMGMNYKMTPAIDYIRFLNFVNTIVNYIPDEKNLFNKPKAYFVCYPIETEINKLNFIINSINKNKKKPYPIFDFESINKNIDVFIKKCKKILDNIGDAQVKESFENQYKLIVCILAIKIIFSISVKSKSEKQTTKKSQKSEKEEIMKESLIDRLKKILRNKDENLHLFTQQSYTFKNRDQTKLVDALDIIIKNSPYIRCFGNITSYHAGPKINIDNVGNIWGHWPLMFNTYTPTLEYEARSITGVDRGLVEGATVCKIINNDRTNPIIPDQSRSSRNQLLGSKNIFSYSLPNNLSGSDKLQLRILKYGKNLKIKSKKQRIKQLRLGKEQSIVHKFSHPKRLFNVAKSNKIHKRWGPTEQVGRQKNKMKRFGRNLVHTLTKGVIEYAEDPLPQEKSIFQDTEIIKNGKLDPRYIQINIEDLSRYSPKKGESLAGLKSQWSRGLFQTILDEKAKRKKIYVQLVAAAYTTVRHYKNPQLIGKKGFILFKLKDSIKILAPRPRLENSENIKTTINQILNSQNPNIDQFWTRQLQSEINTLFNNQLAITIDTDVKFVPNGRGNNMFWNNNGDEYIGRDIGAPVNIGLYNKALHLLTALEININRINSILTKTSDPYLGKYRARIVKYLVDLLKLIKNAAQWYKKRTRENTIIGFRLAKDFISKEIIKTGLIYSIAKPRSKVFYNQSLGEWYNNFKIKTTVTIEKRNFKELYREITIIIDEINNIIEKNSFNTSLPSTIINAMKDIENENLDQEMFEDVFNIIEMRNLDRDERNYIIDPGG